MVVRTFLGLFFGYYLTETALAPGAPLEFRENAMQYFVDIYLHGILVLLNSNHDDGSIKGCYHVQFPSPLPDPQRIHPNWRDQRTLMLVLIIPDHAALPAGLCCHQ